VNAEELENITGRQAVDRDGGKIGKIRQVYVDVASGSLQWVTISTGLSGAKECFAPVRGYRIDGDNVVLNVTLGQVKDAPGVDAVGYLDAAENNRLVAYYGGSPGQASDA
jgi:sporulation protein YlmC with PRC-barrel domain